ncbi:hypothetical protein [Streptomyces sp. NBC_01264]|uniref:hypothetical protein n=1 Tax=Streptomyces sp. NBC_01264 TaxID=2903804 RepID=UPI002255F287|nr:hypothetical protein [Streptomyces sp. NBC_01264]MCX4779341.1 hypothetical protein [Streptomyces sp. NBC_01264]
MRIGEPSQEQLRRTFESVLTNVLSGRGVRTETGLDSPTENALWAIRYAFPEAPDALVAAAYRAFAGQLDGSNAAAWQAEMDRRITERGSRPCPPVPPADRGPLPRPGP